MQVGQEIDAKYILEKPLGDGAMGLVWQARKKDTMTRVALKFVTNTFNSPKIRTLFEREIQNLKSLNHPNIPRFVDENTHFDPPYFAMEYVDGDAYSDLIEGGHLKRIDLRELVSNIFDLASALSHAHAQGLIHRDVKPGNIKGSLNKPYLLDFGIALTLDNADQTEVLRGTIAYMPPEGEASQDGDLFSFAVVAYEMLFGVRPILFKEDNATNPLQALKLVTSRLFKGEWRLPSQLEDENRHPELRGKDLTEIDEVFRQAFALDPHQRHQFFPEVLDFANALGQALMPFMIQRNFNPFSSTTPMFGLVKRKTTENKAVVSAPKPTDDEQGDTLELHNKLSPLSSRFGIQPLPKFNRWRVAVIIFFIIGLGVIGLIIPPFIPDNSTNLPRTEVAQIRSSESTATEEFPSKTPLSTRTSTTSVDSVIFITDVTTATSTASRTPPPILTATSIVATETNDGVSVPTTMISPTRTMRPTVERIVTTATSTATNTLAPTVTNTRIATSTATNTLIPTVTYTHTATSIATNTLIPIATDTHTVTPTPTKIFTAIPTATVTLTPTKTLTSTAIPTATPVPLSATPATLVNGEIVYFSALITNRAYRACNAEAPQECPPPTLGADSMTNSARQGNPVVGVTWKNALNFCLLQGGRLLSRTEWEMLIDSEQLNVSSQTILSEWLMTDNSVRNTVWQLQTVRDVLANTQMPIGDQDGNVILQSVARTNENVGFRCAFVNS